MPDDTTSIEAVLFDADGVLQRTRPGWRELLESIGGPGFPEVLFAAESGPLVGAEPMPDAVHRVLVEHGLDPDPWPVLRAWEYIELDHAAIDVVTRLRAAGTPCHLASNQHAFRARYMRDVLRYGDVLDELFFSSELGVAKPDPRFFTMICERLGLPPGRLLFIDDLAANVTGARAAGLNAARLDPDDGATGLERLLGDHGLAICSPQLH